MAKISVTTPTHNTKWLVETFDSLLRQTHPDWEWIILPNKGAVVPAEIDDDPRVRVIDDYQPLSDLPIGAIKARAASYATGDVILELDHDDLLTADALAEVSQAFDADSDVDFVYTNFAEFNDANKTPHCYDASYGWRYRTTVVDGVNYQEALACPAIPPYITNITHAPNHIRAWRASFYREIGGHDITLDVSDDFDLVVRTYLRARIIKHIPKLLYLYRMFGQNTWIQKNQAIQERTKQIYEKQIIPMMLRFCSDGDLIPLDLGAAHSKPSGFKGCDVRDAPGVDYVFDLEGEWPFDDNSVGVIRCYDVLEHVHTDKKIHFFNEAWRVLAPGGAILIEVPSAHGDGAFMDPTHRSFWVTKSFWYSTMEDYQRYVRPDAVHAFMARELTEHFPSDWHRQNNVPYVRAHLFAVKPDGHPHPLPLPSMFPPRNWKPRPAGTVVYTPPPKQIGASAQEDQVIDDGDFMFVDDSMIDPSVPFDKMLMAVDRTTPFSTHASTSFIKNVQEVFDKEKRAPAFRCSNHVLEYLSIVYVDGQVHHLAGHFVPRPGNS